MLERELTVKTRALETADSSGWFVHTASWFRGEPLLAIRSISACAGVHSVSLSIRILF